MDQRRKNIRLSEECYIGTRAYSITICANARQDLFTDCDLVLSLMKILRETLTDEFDVHIYTFMPDHLHILMSGKNHASDMVRSLKLFKQKTGYWYKQKFNEKLWQKSFFDRVLRSEDSVEGVAWYILNNPVRAGLVKDPFNYRFSGSFFYDDLEFLKP